MTALERHVLRKNIKDYWIPVAKNEPGSDYAGYLMIGGIRDLLVADLERVLKVLDGEELTA